MEAARAAEEAATHAQEQAQVLAAAKAAEEAVTLAVAAAAAGAAEVQEGARTAAAQKGAADAAEAPRARDGEASRQAEAATYEQPQTPRAAAAAAQAAVALPPRLKVWLEGKSGWISHDMPLREGVSVVGCATDCDLVVSTGVEDGVSRRHAQLRVSGAACFITDQGSAQGAAEPGPNRP